MSDIKSERALAILDWLNTHDAVATPRVLAFELRDYSHNSIKTEMRSLREFGFVAPPDEAPDGLSTTGVYRLTEDGRRYLNGDMTVAELRELRNQTE